MVDFFLGGSGGGGGGLTRTLENLDLGGLSSAVFTIPAGCSYIRYNGLMGVNGGGGDIRIRLLSSADAIQNVEAVTRPSTYLSSTTDAGFATVGPNVHFFEGWILNPLNASEKTNGVIGTSGVTRAFKQVTAAETAKIEVSLSAGTFNGNLQFHYWN